jgi:hypothetical protein
MSTELADQEIAQVAAWLSSERLAAFLKIAGTERDAFELHQQMMVLAGALMPVVGVIEITLRNAICDRLRQHFGVPNWLNSPPPPFQWRGEEVDALVRATRQGQRAEYAKKSNTEKRALDAIAYPNGVPPDVSHETRAKARQRAITITTGQQIAQLTILFWKRLFSADYEATLWARSLKHLFPNKALTRGQVAAELEALYQARNRIAHHEPLYGPRLEQTLVAIDFLAENFEARKPGPDALIAKVIAPLRVRLQQEADTLAAMLAKFQVTAPPTP